MKNGFLSVKLRFFRSGHIGEADLLCKSECLVHKNAHQIRKFYAKRASWPDKTSKNVGKICKNLQKQTAFEQKSQEMSRFLVRFCSMCKGGLN